jgi:hypothetical protein
MSVSKNTNQLKCENSTIKVRGPFAAASRTSDRKVPGTRAGTIQDWRASGTKKAGEKSERSKRLRDGR